MSDQSAVELAREADIARANVSETAQSIRDKMTPGQLIDEFTSVFSGGDSSAALQHLKSQIRDNPLPLTLVGAGLAWLMLGQGSSPNGTAYAHTRSPNGILSTSSDKGLGTSAGEMVTNAAGFVASTAQDAADVMREGAADLGDRVKSTAGTQALQSAQQFLQQDPLVLAALGVALGTAIGTLLPHTSLEDEQLGSTSAGIRKKAAEVLDQAVEGVKDVAAEAYETMKEEADRQGLSGTDGGSLVEKAGKIVTATVSKSEEGLRNRIASETGPEKT
jgi:ElaB/YqjD/DUF883 family membrane-anchored ribosome-binding protein